MGVGWWWSGGGNADQNIEMAYQGNGSCIPQTAKNSVSGREGPQSAGRKSAKLRTTAQEPE